MQDSVSMTELNNLKASALEEAIKEHQTRLANGDRIVRVSTLEFRINKLRSGKE